MPYFQDTCGTKVWYEDQGQGVPVVLLHGWCMSSAVWNLQRTSLSDRFRIITPDLPGHGKSPDPSDGFSLSSCATSVARLCQYLGLEKIVLAGWSMGADVVLETFSHLGNSLSGLILIGATPCFTQKDGFPYALSLKEADGMALKVRRSLQRALDGFTGLMFTPEEMGDLQKATLIRSILADVVPPETTIALQALDELVQADYRNILQTINLPTLLIHGDCDAICLPRASHYLAGQIAASQRILFSNCGHAPFITQQEQFDTCLDKFSRRVYGSGN